MDSTEFLENISSRHFAVGSVVFDRYKILGYIASGGKGHVYQAKDINLDITVALKVLIRDASQDKEIVRFQTEAKLASKLLHKNIATIYDFGLFEATPYLSMEYIDGESLQSLLDRKGRLPLSFVIDVCIQIIDALTYAHSQGIVHRDIKPGNVVVSDKTTELVVKVLDFGVAKKLDVALATSDGRLTVTGDVIGSPFYMSPEQSKGQNVYPASDAYSLGCLIWTSLVGQPPLTGESILETLMLVQNTVPPSVATCVDNLPEEIVTIVDRLLSKNAERRPPLRDEVLPLLIKTRETLTVSEIDIKSDTTLEDSHVRKSVSLFVFGFCLIGALVVTMTVILPRSNPMEQPQDAPLRDSDSNLSPPLQEVASAKIFAEEILIQGSQMDIIDCKDQTLAKKKYLNLEEIETVSVRDSDVTDQCFSIFATYPNLKSLSFSNTDVSDLNGVEKLSNLRVLNIHRCVNVTTRSMEKLGSLKKLQLLGLQNSFNITDSALPRIAKISSLQRLGLEGTRVTGSEFDSLLALKKLSTLDLKNTGVTAGAVRKVLSTHPNLNIIMIEGCRNISKEQAKALSLEFPDRQFYPATTMLNLLHSAILRSAEDEQFSDAIAKSKMLIDMLKKVGGARNPDLVEPYINLGQFYARLHTFGPSRQCFEKALEIASATGDTKAQLHAHSGLDHISIVESRNRLSPKLEQALLKTFSFAENHIPPNSFEMALRYGHMGDTYKMCRKSEASIPWYLKALKVCDQLTVPQVPPFRAQLHIHLAEALSDVGRLDEAGKEATIGLDQLFEIHNLPGGYRIDFCRAYSCLASNAIRKYNYEQALEFNDKALTQMKRLEITATRVREELYQQRALILTQFGRPDEAAAVTEYLNKLKSD